MLLCITVLHCFTKIYVCNLIHYLRSGYSDFLQQVLGIHVLPYVLVVQPNQEHQQLRALLMAHQVHGHQTCLVVPRDQSNLDHHLVLCHPKLTLMI